MLHDILHLNKPLVKNFPALKELITCRFKNFSWTMCFCFPTVQVGKLVVNFTCVVSRTVDQN